MFVGLDEELVLRYIEILDKEVKLFFLSFFALYAHYLLNSFPDVKNLDIPSELFGFDLCVVKHVLDQKVHKRGRVLLDLQTVLQLVDHIQEGLLLELRHHYDFLQVFVKVGLLYIRRDNRVQGVPELMGDTRVDHREKLVFRFELSELMLGLVLRKEDVVRDVYDLDHFLYLLPVEVRIYLDLKVLFRGLCLCR